MKHKIRLMDEQGKEYVSTTDMWDKLKDLPDPDVIFHLMTEFERFKNFLFPFLRKIVKERIVKLLEYSSSHYKDFHKEYADFIGPTSLTRLVDELLNEKKIEYVHGWYRLPKEVIIEKPM